MPWYRFDRATLPTMPWMNGGGVTREIACWPPGAGFDTFDWRMSIATIASDGPFSVFAGTDRVITLLEGGGVHLATGDGAIDHRLDTSWAPFAFPGEATIHGRLLAGECADLNVMTRRTVCRAEVRALRQSSQVSAPDGLLLAVQGVWSVQAEGHEVQALPVQMGLWWHHDAQAEAITWHLHPRTPDAVLLTVTIHPKPATTR